MKIALIHNADKFAGKLTRFWTGCNCYHIGLLDEETNTFYDMDLLPRKSAWPKYNTDNVVLFNAPAYITRQNCEEFLRHDSSITYGWKDYMLFSLRPIYHLFGKSTRNAGGWICSEMVNNWLWRIRPRCTPWAPEGEPPSPCDFFRFLSAK